MIGLGSFKKNDINENTVSYYTFENHHLANLCSLNALDPVQLVAEELLGKQAGSADLLQWNALHLIENICMKYKRETKL